MQILPHCGGLLSGDWEKSPDILQLVQWERRNRHLLVEYKLNAAVRAQAVALDARESLHTLRLASAGGETALLQCHDTTYRRDAAGGTIVYRYTGPPPLAAVPVGALKGPAAKLPVPLAVHWQDAAPSPSRVASGLAGA